MSVADYLLGIGLAVFLLLGAGYLLAATLRWP